MQQTQNIKSDSLAKLLEFQEGVIVFDEELQILRFNQKAIDFFLLRFNERCGSENYLYELPTRTSRFVSDYLDKASKAKSKMYQKIESFTQGKKSNRKKYFYNRFKKYAGLKTQHSDFINRAFLIHAYFTNSYNVLRINEVDAIVRYERYSLNRILNKRLTLNLLMWVVIISGFFNTMANLWYQQSTSNSMQKTLELMYESYNQYQFFRDSLKSTKYEIDTTNTELEIN